MLKCVTILSLFLVPAQLRSQEIPNDTIPVVPLREVVVTATRSPISRTDAPTTVSLLNSAAIRLRSGWRRS